MRQQLPILGAIAGYLKTLGLPFLLGGDWQCSPQELEATGFTRLLCASICEPGEPTNTQAGSTLDYWVVSDGLLSAGWTAATVIGCRFTPHVPCALKLWCRGRQVMADRLCVPKPLPVHRPIGPPLPGVAIRWEDWDALQHLLDGRAQGEEAIARALDEWFAGAEAELCVVLGVDGSPDAHRYRGMGQKPTTVKAAVRGRFRDSVDGLGILGHRLAWCARALQAVSDYGSALGMADDGEASEAAKRRAAARRRLEDHVSRVGHRAIAFSREPMSDAGPEEPVRHAQTTLKKALRWLGNMVRSRHGQAPMLTRWGGKPCQGDVLTADGLRTEVDKAYLSMAARLKRKEVKRVAKWAKEASLREAHAATKPAAGALPCSASGSKGHKGESTEQKAADHGPREWGRECRAQPHDGAEEILRQLEALTAEGQLEEDVCLPPLTGAGLAEVSPWFRGGTGLGTDTRRPRHVAWLSRGCLDALAAILTLME